MLHWIIALLVPTAGQVFAQKFGFTDSVFAVHAEHTMPCMLNNFEPHIRTSDSTFYNSYKASVDSLVAFIDTHPHLILEIGVYTDYRGAEDFNLNISQEQAKNFILFLKHHGASTFHLLPKGYGEIRLINPPESIEKMATEEEREFAHGQNGRVVVKILAI